MQVCSFYFYVYFCAYICIYVYLGLVIGIVFFIMYRVYILFYFSVYYITLILFALLALQVVSRPLCILINEMNFSSKAKNIICRFKAPPCWLAAHFASGIIIYATMRAGCSWRRWRRVIQISTVYRRCWTPYGQLINDRPSPVYNIIIIIIIIIILSFREAQRIHRVTVT